MVRSGPAEEINAERSGPKTMKRKKSALLSDNSENVIISDSIALLREAGYGEGHIGQFSNDAVSILNDYAELIGENTEIEYILVKTFTRMELRLFIPGMQYDPFKSGTSATKRKLENVFSVSLNTETARVSYRYDFGYNLIAVSLPLTERRKSVVKNPTVIAVVLGIILGLLCQRLPAPVNTFIVDDIASPVLSIILSLLTGFMGPFIFFSLVASIITMDSINALSNLGTRIIRRFIMVILFLIAVSIAVSLLFFRNFGTESVSFAPKQLIQIFLDIVPTNPLQAFLENKTPQLVILGFLLGSALLILGNRVSGLKDTLAQMNEWIMSAMKIVLMVVPAIPFLSIFTLIAKGNGSQMLEGWKYIAASYVAYAVSVVCKLVKTSAKTGIRIPQLWAGIKPLVKMAFTTGSTSAPVGKCYEVSESEFHIKPEFTSFWIPMCSAMLSTKTAINVVIAVFMVAEMTGVAVSASFLLVLVLVTLELSIASPGTTSALTIIFATLSMPTDYVGLFTVYRLLINNFSAGCSEAYAMLEQVEAAYKLDGIQKESGGNAAS